MFKWGCVCFTMAKVGVREMNCVEKISEDLGIPPLYTKKIEDEQIVCTVHSQWLSHLLTQNRLPENFFIFGTLNDSARQQLLNQFDNLPKSQWKCIIIQRVHKTVKQVCRIPGVLPAISANDVDLNYFQLIHYVTDTNYRNLWKKAWRTYSGISNQSINKTQSLKSHLEAIQSVVKRLFACPIIQLNKNHSSQSISSHCSPSSTTFDLKDICHPNLVQVVCAVECEDDIYILFKKPSYNLQQCIMFSPAVLETSVIRRHFVTYQLLHILRFVHNLGLHIGAITLKEIFVEQNLWIQVFPKIFCDILEDCEMPVQNSNILAEEKYFYDDFIINSVTQKSSTATDEVKHSVSHMSVDCISNDKEDLPTLTEMWINGVISNFSYLLHLNRLAGRVPNNPHCHPVIPWVTNFSVPEGGWRDLAKSKFRINKGDKQLDLIYESSSYSGNSASYGNITNFMQSSAINVPHHIADVLSDITYYVYKARRLPKSILCKHVRQKWVPAEYPSTIERLQEWSPDECIPEFFSDPSIFISIHSDLPDLGIPSWCQGPEDFIKRHRAALESDHVSERLHNWIDLTFGYKLAGNAAVKAKNVCLPLVDQHTYISSGGMVQLFSHPHPHKMSSSLYFSYIAPKTFRNVATKIHDAKDSGEDETSSENSGKAGRWKVLRSKSMPAGTEQLRSETRPENLTVILSKDYNPLLAMRHLESFYTFLAKCNSGKLLTYKNKEKMENSKSGECCLHHQNKDMLVLGCIISEMCLASHLKSIIRHLTLEDRYQMNVHLLKAYKHEVPRCFWQIIQLLLQLSPSFEIIDSCTEIKTEFMPWRYPSVSAFGLPPPSPHQLLQPLIHAVPFPPYFPALYFFLENLNSYSRQLHAANSLNVDSSFNNSKIEDIAQAKVRFAAKELHHLLPRLNSEAIELLIPYLHEMFENQHTSLLAAWHLFNTVSQSLGPQKTAQKLLKALIKVFDPDILSSKHLKLYHRTFLLQLIVRLGLQNFLAYFMTVLIEAVGGLKDFLPVCSEGIDVFADTQTELRRKSSHLLSPELQEMAKESERILNASQISKSSRHENSSQLDPNFNDMDDEKDPEMFDFDENSEESVQMPKHVDQHPASALQATLLQDEEKCQGIESVDHYSEDIRMHLTASEDDSSDEEEVDPDVIDAITSPVTELKKCSKNSIYSHSAPNFTSHLSDYKKLNECCDFETVVAEHSVKDGAYELGTDVVNTILSPVLSKQVNTLNISDVAVESIMWLAHRLGPVLTARYLTRNLLRMLTLCYEGQEKREIISEVPENSEQKSCLSISKRWYSGDRFALKVLDCLSRVAALYGEQFIMLQYLPHISDLLNWCKKRVSGTLESGLIGAMTLLQYIIPYLSDATLMDHLQDVIIKDIIYLVIRLISSLRLTFPNGGQSRWIITCRLIDIVYIIGLRIGFEMTRTLLSSTLQRFFSCFDKVYDHNGKLKSFQDMTNINTQNLGNSPLKERALEEMKQAFTAEIAYISYIPFCKLAGGIFMEHALKNDELIRHLCLQHDLNIACSSTDLIANNGDPTRIDNTSSVKSHRRDPSVGQEDSFVSGVFGKNVAVVGNRLDVQLGDEGHLVAAVADSVPNVLSPGVSKSIDIPKYDISLLRRKMDNNQRHLKGNWLAYWEHEKGRSEKDDHFNFKQIKLQSFIGHTGAIRTIQVLDNENSFLTSSKDKTVKLWSLRSYGDGSAQTPCQWTYTQHRKSVFAVSFLDSLRLVGSCDSTVHIWDPFMGSCIKQIEPTKGSPITVLTSMPAPSVTFLAATTNSTVRFLDARTCRYMHEFKVSIGTTGLIRCLAVCPNGNWLAVGHSTGMISVVDVRTGLLLGTWMGHEGEILQLKPFNNSYFVTSSLDHCVSVWNSEDSQSKCNLRGPMEPVTSLCFYKGEVVSGTAGNKIGLHTSIDRKATYSSTRLRSDTFKGMLTTMALLPLNRLLLIGADNGNLMLLS